MLDVALSGSALPSGFPPGTAGVSFHGTTSPVLEDQSLEVAGLKLHASHVAQIVLRSLQEVVMGGFWFKTLDLALLKLVLHLV